MQRGVMVGALVALSLFAAAPAGAQETGQDEVTLNDGSRIRGTVVASEPGTSVKIIELGGTVPRVFPWSAVSGVERGKYAPHEAPPPDVGGILGGRGAAPGTMPKLGAPGVVRLHVESPVPAEVVVAAVSTGYVGGYGFQLSRTLCFAPCDRVIDGSQGQYFQVRGRFPTASFDLLKSKGDMTLKVDPGKSGARIAGILFTALGGAAMLAGGAGLAFSASAAGDYADIRTPSIGLLAGGSAVLIAGVVMWVKLSTHLKLEPSAVAMATTARAPRYWAGEF